MKKYIVKKDESGQTLEKYVKKIMPAVPLSVIEKLFRKKDIKINGHRKDKKAIISPDDEVSIYITDADYDRFNSEKKEIVASNYIEQFIVYEDENILIVNKPRGMLVQKDKASGKALDDFVLSYLKYKNEYIEDNKAFTPGPAHRLDRNTAGLVIFGKNIATLQYLMSIMQDKNRIEKRYLALVKGKVDKPGKIDVPLKKIENKSLVKVDKVTNGAKEAITLYEPIKVYKDYTLLSVRLLTGRTHQIRVHMAYINHPVIGDNKYGDFLLNKEIEKKYGLTNQFLVANFLKFHNLDYPLDYLSEKEFEIGVPNNIVQILNI
ncbi:MAG: RluA family pseudouridine synthase [Bacilli bacterium]|nr:RluA family pseudouridine synthase [Bacilli bacterium]